VTEKMKEKGKRSEKEFVRKKRKGSWIAGGERI
jgi:hypothetical protein